MEPHWQGMHRQIRKYFPQLIWVSEVEVGEVSSQGDYMNHFGNITHIEDKK